MGAFRANAEAIKAVKKFGASASDTATQAVAEQGSALLWFLGTVRFDVYPLILTFVGISFAIASLWDGYLFDDRYPGYGKVGKKRDENLKDIERVRRGLSTEVLSKFKKEIKDTSETRDKLISQNISDWMEHVYIWIRNRKDVNAEKIIVIGISFGGAMVLMTSLKKEIQKHPPKSVLVYGTYYDIETTLKFLMTGKLLVNGQEKGVKVNEWGLIAFFHNYLSRIEIGYDTSSVKKILKLSVQEKNEKVEEVLNKISGKEKELITQILSGRANEEIIRITSDFIKNE